MMKGFVRKNLANLITMGRIPLCFSSFALALVVIYNFKDGDHVHPIFGFLGVVLLILTALTDYWDGLVARKLKIESKIGPLADQMMDKMVYCIMFPTIAVGVMRIELDLISKGVSGNNKIMMGHVILALILCVTMLVRDHYVGFLRTIADRHKVDSGVKQIGKIRTFLALPISCALYAYCFCRGEFEDLYYLNAIFIWIKEIDVKQIMTLEVILIIVNIVSAISYTRTYGPCLMDEICDDDQVLRKKILSIFPNMLTAMNAVMGVSAAILAYRGHFHLAFVLLIFATIFDKLDGAAARKLGLTEDPIEGERHITLGMVLDDIADFISFCVAPAAIAHAYMQDYEHSPWLAIYAILGLARLLYFTMDKKPIPGFFKGLPSPAAAILAGGIVHTAQMLDPDASKYSAHVLIAFLVTGVLMNAYFIHYVHFGRLMSRSKNLTRFVFVILAIGIFAVKAFGLIALALMALYLASPLFYRSNQISS